jgi:hypothetical protein
MHSLSEQRLRDSQMYFQKHDPLKGYNFKSHTVFPPYKFSLSYSTHHKTSYECYVLIPIDLFMKLVAARHELFTAHGSINNEKYFNDCVETAFFEAVHDWLSSYYCSADYHVDVVDGQLVIHMIVNSTFNKDGLDRSLSDELFVRFLQKFRNSVIDRVYGISWSYQE